jgi:hypothetical protein
VLVLVLFRYTELQQVSTTSLQVARRVELKACDSS